MNVAFLMGVGALEIIFFLGPMLLLGVLWVWALIDILRSRFSDSTQQIVWLLVVIFVPLIGSILYFAIGRSARKTVNQ